MKVYRYKKQPKKQIIKKIFFRTIILAVILTAGYYLYDMYKSIGIEKKEISSTPEITAERASQTIEQIKENSKKITDMLEEATVSVVGISKVKNTGDSVFLKDGTSQLGLGTGIIVSENGYILSNQHVTGEKLSNCYVTLEDGKTYNASVVWSDFDIDLSIIKINANGLIPAKLGDSNLMKPGETVYAIGNPIGYEFRKTVTSGIISAIDRIILLQEENKSIYLYDLMQTDATINPGNSGGPLITPDGEVIGVNSIKITSAEGIGFAVPINIIKPIIESFKNNGSFEEASLGIFAYDSSVISYIEENIKLEKGIYVENIVLDSSADNKELHVGDVILKLNGKEINKMRELREYIYSKKPSDEITLNIMRNNKNIDIKVKLGKR